MNSPSISILMRSTEPVKISEYEPTTSFLEPSNNLHVYNTYNAHPELSIGDCRFGSGKGAGLL